jgi:hypothetical protein
VLSDQLRGVLLQMGMQLKTEDFAAFNRILRKYFTAWPNVRVDDVMAEFWWENLSMFEAKDLEQALLALSTNENTVPSLARVRRQVAHIICSED